MYLYLLTNLTDYGYDEVAGYVVVARSGQEARQLAQKMTSDIPIPNVFLDPKTSRLTVLGTASPTIQTPHIVLRDMREG